MGFVPSCLHTTRPAAAVESPMPLTDPDLRLSLLQLAVSANADDPIKMAGQFEAFVLAEAVPSNTTRIGCGILTDNLPAIQHLLDTGVPVSAIARQYGRDKSAIWTLIAKGKLAKKKSPKAVEKARRLFSKKLAVPQPSANGRTIPAAASV